MQRGQFVTVAVRETLESRAQPSSCQAICSPKSDKIGAVIGRADYALLLRVNRALALFLSIV
jgi:hypothetical protein